MIQTLTATTLEHCGSLIVNLPSLVFPLFYPKFHFSYSESCKESCFLALSRSNSSAVIFNIFQILFPIYQLPFHFFPSLFCLTWFSLFFYNKQYSFLPVKFCYFCCLMLNIISPFTLIPTSNIWLKVSSVNSFFLLQIMLK